MSEVENKFGQKLSYSYTKDTKTGQDQPRPGNSTETKPVDLALYPETINYPHNRYRVSFTRSSTLRGRLPRRVVEQLRHDVFFHRYRLEKIEIQHDPDGSGPTGWSDGAHLRAELQRREIVPRGYTWSAGGKTFAVVSRSSRPGWEA